MRSTPPPPKKSQQSEGCPRPETKSQSVNIAAAKAHLAELVQRAAGGEEIIIARNGEPQARLVPLQRPKPRQPGHGAGMWEIVGDFNAPLPDELLTAFTGPAT